MEAVVEKLGQRGTGETRTRLDTGAKIDVLNMASHNFALGTRVLVHAVHRCLNLKIGIVVVIIIIGALEALVHTVRRRSNAEDCYCCYYCLRVGSNIY